MCKEHYLVVMNITEPHIGHTPFLSAMGLKVSIWRERVVYDKVLCINHTTGDILMIDSCFGAGHTHINPINKTPWIITVRRKTYRVYECTETILYS